MPGCASWFSPDTPHAAALLHTLVAVVDAMYDAMRIGATLHKLHKPQRKACHTSPGLAPIVRGLCIVALQIAASIS